MQGQSPDYAKIIVTAFWEALRVFVSNPLGWLVLTVLGLVPFLKGLSRWMDQRRLAAAGMDEVDRFSGKDFEKFMEVLFQRLGYSVERTQYVGDFGADVVLVKSGVLRGPP